MKFQVGLFGIPSFIKSMCPFNRKLFKTPIEHITNILVFANSYFYLSVQVYSGFCLDPITNFVMLLRTHMWS